MLQYFYAFGPQIQRLRTECGMASAIAGIFKAPFDIIADKLRGYLGLTMDMHEQPDKVLAACEALMPHLCHVGLTTADPGRSRCPLDFGCTAAACRSSIRGNSTRITGPPSSRSSRNSGKMATRPCFTPKANGPPISTPSANCRPAAFVFHWTATMCLPRMQKLHDKFAISGGIPNTLLSFGKPGEVRDFCKRVIDEVAPRWRLYHGCRGHHAERHQH